MRVRQDKYILGSMVILCGVCVWHALIGAVILPLTQPSTLSSSADAVTTSLAFANVTASSQMSTALTTATTIGQIGNSNTSYPLTTSDTGSGTSTTCTSQSSSSTSITDTAQTADNIALGTFGSLYVTFHLVFVALISCSVSNFSNHILIRCLDL